MKKKFLSFVLIFAILESTVAFGNNEKDLKLYLNSNIINFTDQQPIIKNNRVLVPLRTLLESMDVEVTYIEGIKTVSMQKGSTGASLKLGEDILTVNNKKIKLDVPAELINDRVMIPVRAIAEGFDAAVEWNENNNAIYITTENSDIYTKKSYVQLQEYENYNSVSQFWTVKSTDKVLLNVNISYPAIKNTVMSDNINVYIAKSAHTIAEKYIDENIADIQRENSSFVKQIDISFEDLYIDYEKHILSYLITFSFYNENDVYTTYGYGMTIDTSVGSEVSVSGNGNTAADIDKAFNYIKKEVSLNPDYYIESINEELKAGNYGCYFGDNKLIIFAAPGNIKPYEYGMVKFEVPLVE